MTSVSTGRVHYCPTLWRVEEDDSTLLDLCEDLTDDLWRLLAWLQKKDAQELGREMGFGRVDAISIGTFAGVAFFPIVFGFVDPVIWRTADDPDTWYPREHPDWEKLFGKC